ncbi:hypothetical protein PVAP13_2NG125103 [Panicum virgatum]|uniref:Uncharacterized protein n=1 Tax=Panicum virgatum TaxID=38727 RepID=A0A8T0VEJ6_PANVG|nr:hypothetical protein PVAP13_2NG125103 [Panicum virgatum]
MEQLPACMCDFCKSSPRGIRALVRKHQLELSSWGWAVGIGVCPPPPSSSHCATLCPFVALAFGAANKELKFLAAVCRLGYLRKWHQGFMDDQ